MPIPYFSGTPDVRAAGIEQLMRSRPLPAWMTQPDAQGFAQPSATPLDIRAPASRVSAAPELSRPAADAPAAPAGEFAPGVRDIAPAAPVPVADPFRLNNPGLGPVRGKQEGDLFRYDQNDPLANNPMMYRDGDVWRSSVQQGSLGPNGFTPGFMNSGVGGQREWAADPTQALILSQRAAQAAGVSPQFTVNTLMEGLNRGADMNLRANLGAQVANTQIGQANLNARTTTSEGAAGRASTERIADRNLQGQEANAQRQMVSNLIAAGVQNPAALTPAFMSAIGPMMQQAMPGGRMSSPGAGAAVTPAAPASGQPAPAGAPAGASPAAPGAPAAANPAAAAFAGLQRLGESQQLVANLRPAFGIGADGAIPAKHQITPQMAMQLLDRMQGAGVTDAQRREIASAIQARQFGDPEQVRRALLQATAMSHLVAAPPKHQSPTRGPVEFGWGVGSAIAGDNGYEPLQSPLSIPDYAIQGSNGELFRVRRGEQSVLGVAGNHLLHGGNPYNEVVDRNGVAHPLERRWWGEGADTTPTATHRHRADQGSGLLELLGVAPAPARR